VSGVLPALRLKRYGVQLVAGLAIGVALGGAVREARAEDAASLVANPKRLDEVQRGCKTNALWATETLCREAAQAIRLRFRGAGVPYTPHRVDPFPNRPAAKQSAPALVPGKPRDTRRVARGAPHPVSGRP